MNVTMYGIRNCDTVKKARAWLEDHHVAFDFHDYKSAGIDRERIASWAAELGWERLVNRSGTTFRKLADEKKQDLNEAKAIDLMEQQPSMIRRPLIEKDGRFLVGFDPERYRQVFL
jgi:arsenate reductase